MIKGDEGRGDERMDYVVKTTGLTKKVKGKNLVSDVDLHIRKGEIYGFLGQNGAGKTTFAKSLAEKYDLIFVNFQAMYEKYLKHRHSASIA